MGKNKLRQLIREEIANLNESNMSGAIYHFTKLRRLDSILNGNSFILTSALGKEGEERHQRGRMYFASLTTVRNGGVGYQGNENMDVRIAFDARKLGFNHKLVPAQYYQNVEYWLPGTRATQDENEVRLVSDTQFIDNISKYIKYIDVYAHPNDDGDVFLKRVYASVKKLGIEIRFYTSKATFKIGGERYNKLMKAKIADYEESEASKSRRRSDRPEIYTPSGSEPIYGKSFYVPYILLKMFNRKSMLNIFIKYIIENFNSCGKKADAKCDERSIRALGDVEYNNVMGAVLDSYNSMKKNDELVMHFDYMSVIFSTNSDELFNDDILLCIKQGKVPLINKTLYKIYTERKRYINRMVKNGDTHDEAASKFFEKYVLKK
jgi:hypothetical protein